MTGRWLRELLLSARFGVCLLVVAAAGLFWPSPALAGDTYDHPICAYDGSALVDTPTTASSVHTANVRVQPVPVDAGHPSHSYDASANCYATNTARPAVGFAPGEGVSALTAGRLQHGTRHLTEAGVLPAWRGSTSPQLIRDTLSPILESPIATFNNTLGGAGVKGFIGAVNGQTVAVQVFAEGPLTGQLATSVVPSANQLLKWGVVLP